MLLTLVAAAFPALVLARDDPRGWALGAPCDDAGAGCLIFAASPDGTYGHGDLYLVSTGGGDLLRITQTSGNESSPTWSPDGRRIAYRYEPAFDGPTYIYAMDADGSNATNLTGRHEAYSPAWSPDGKKIAFAGGDTPIPDIYVMNADGSSMRRLTRSPRQIDEYPAWSPDGRKIIFSSTRGGAYSGTARSLWAMNADGSRQRRLTRGHYDMSPSFSPDGRRIVFASNRRQRDPRAKSLWIMNANGSGLHRVPVRGRWGEAWSPSWGRSGLIAFIADERVAVIRPDGSGLRRLTPKIVGTDFPAWRR